MSYYLPPQHLLYGGPVPLPFDPIAEAHRNWDAQGWGRSAEMAAVTPITRAHQIALQRIDAALEPFGLNFSRFEALALLHFTRAGALPMGKIGDRLQVHPTSVTNTIDRLEAGRPCRLDTKRKVLLALGLKVSEKDQLFVADEGTAGTAALIRNALGTDNA